MRFVYLFFLVISVCVLSGFSYALDISGCTDLNSDYIDQTLTLTQDINGWVGSCFQLTEDASGKYFELDCTGHNIDF